MNQILHDQSELRSAAQALSYIVDHGLLPDLEEWLGTQMPPARRDPDRQWRIEHGSTAQLAGLLSDLTGASYSRSLAATCAELEPLGLENRCELICDFADAHKRHGAKFYGVLYRHLGDDGQSPPAKPTAVQPVWRRRGGAA